MFDFAALSMSIALDSMIRTAAATLVCLSQLRHLPMQAGFLYLVAVMD